MGRPRKSDGCTTCEGHGATPACPECDSVRVPSEQEPCPRCWLTTCFCEVDR